jgi:chromosomal replication initiation ATPase DnaA
MDEATLRNIVREIIRDELGLVKRPIVSLLPAAAVLDTVAQISGFDRDDLLSHHQIWREIALARGVAAVLIRHRLKYTYPQIGRVLNRDESTINYMVRQHERRMDNAYYRAIYEAALRATKEAA